MIKLYFILALLWVNGAVYAEISQPVTETLGNGLRYTILPLHQDQQRIEIRMKVNAGSVDELNHQAGVAHMVEHLVFRATQDYPQGVMNYLHSQKWQRAKHYNAVTTNDSTTYMLLPPKQFGLEQSLSTLKQMLFYAQLTSQDLDKERQIIMEEWRSGQGVASRMNMQRTQSVRVDSRYARHQPIGTQQSIQTMPVSELQKFYQTWYVPNNMQLLIVGDVDVAQTKKLIEQQFASISAKILPQRDYYEPKLSSTLRLMQLQDAQSGVSQIAYIFRFNEALHRTQTLDARKQRLIDRLALEWLDNRLKNQQGQYLKPSVKSVVVRKSDIGKTSVALGLFSSVNKVAHRDGLKQILLEIERLKQYPITQDELNQLKKEMQKQLDRAKLHTEDRDFQAWTQLMVNTVMVDKPYLTQQQIAQLTQPLLEQIQLQDIQQRIDTWFSSTDQIIQYQAPNLTKIKPFTQAEVKNLQQQIKQMTISAPHVPTVVQAKELPLFTRSPVKIKMEKKFHNEQVVQWDLANGDKVVWLKTPLASDKTYLQMINHAGFKRSDLNAWQAQIASQLMVQHPPLDWTDEQFADWKKRHKINISLNHTAYKLKLEANAPLEQTAELLHLYHLLHQEMQIKHGLNDIKQQFERNLNQQNQDIQQRNQQINQLRFGQNQQYILPTQQEIQQLDIATLNQQWSKIRQTPSIYYVVNNATEQQMKAWVQRYLATISRDGDDIKTQPTPIPMGRNILYLPTHIEPKHEVQMWITSPHDWQGEDAMMISALKSIASQKLKSVLRDEQLGIYRLSFESTLNPELDQIESELKFSTAPEKSREMIEQAEYVLQHLAEMLNEQDVKNIKMQFIQQEQERLKYPETWLNRLVLSHQKYQDSRYLTQMHIMSKQITLARLKALASKLYYRDGVKILVNVQQ